MRTAHPTHFSQRDAQGAPAPRAAPLRAGAVMSTRGRGDAAVGTLSPAWFLPVYGGSLAWRPVSVIAKARMPHSRPHPRGVEIAQPGIGDKLLANARLGPVAHPL
jgi:hypothetical protein